MQTINPATWDGLLKHVFPKISKSHQHHAALHYSGVKDFVKKLRLLQVRSVAAVAAEFTLLTATRSQSVRVMQWSEVDWDNRVWVIPQEQTKTKRFPHHVPLSARAIELLKMRKQQSRGQFVFYGYLATQPLSHVIMRQTLIRMGVDATIHGFRSTFKQWAGEQTEYPRELVEICLEHKVGNAVEEAYWRSALDRRRPLMDDWAAHCQGS